MSWYLEVLKRYAQFDGRARRKEYWFFQLFNLVIYFGLILVGGGAVAAFGRSGNSGMTLAFMAPAYLYALAVLLPGLAVAIRRLHDTGRSGWWLFISLVPFVGGIILLVILAQDSQPVPNPYGLCPKLMPGYGPMNTARTAY